MTIAADVLVRPFRFSVPEDDLIDLRRRLKATRWPEKETVSDFSQGVPLATMQELVRYWADDYDLRRFEARLKAAIGGHRSRTRWAPRHLRNCWESTPTCLALFRPTS